jgi:hypothetical protein
MVGVAVHAAAAFGLDLAAQGVGGVEEEALGDGEQHTGTGKESCVTGCR